MGNPLDNPISNCQPAPLPPPVVAGPPGEEEWEVECIDNARRHYQKLQFLAKWKGWSNADRTWEPVENLAKAVHDSTHGSLGAVGNGSDPDSDLFSHGSTHTGNSQQVTRSRGKADFTSSSSFNLIIILLIGHQVLAI